LGEEQQARRGRREFSDEFKRDAVEIVRTSGKSIAEVARELGIYDSSVGNWVRQDEIDRGERDGLSSDESYELSELRRENARLRMERELLKRVVAFWVTELDE
jgi:transposase-like protein